MSSSASPALVKEEKLKTFLACVRAYIVGYLPILRSRNSPLTRTIQHYEHVLFRTTEKVVYGQLK